MAEAFQADQKPTICRTMISLHGENTFKVFTWQILVKYKTNLTNSQSDSSNPSLHKGNIIPLEKADGFVEPKQAQIIFSTISIRYNISVPTLTHNRFILTTK